MISSIERFSMRTLVNPVLKRDGPNIHNTTVPSVIKESLSSFPFKIISMEPVASSGENGEREVVVYRVDVEDQSRGIRNVVVKIGYTYGHNEGTKSGAHAQAVRENSDARRMQATALASDSLKTDSLISGAKKSPDKCFDVRVQQEFIEGEPLMYIPLFTLTYDNLQALIAYHDRLYRTLMQDHKMPEPGFAEKNDSHSAKLFGSFVRWLPMTSQNVLFNRDTNVITIVDTGRPIETFTGNKSWYKKAQKMVTIAALIQLEKVFLIGIQRTRGLQQRPFRVGDEIVAGK